MVHHEAAVVGFYSRLYHSHEPLYDCADGCYCGTTLSSYHEETPMMLRLLAVVMVLSTASVHAQQFYNPLAVDVTRGLVKDLFSTNAVDYVQPMVTSVNATSNARFFNQAYVPTKVDRPYFRFGIHGMMGVIPEADKTFKPSFNLGEPSQSLFADVSQYGTFDVINRRFAIKPTYQDTLGLTQLLLREALIEAQKQGRFPLPDEAATLFGNRPDVRVNLPSTATLLEVIRNREDYKALVALGGSSIDSSLASLVDSLSLPGSLTMPPGANMSTLVAAVPQLEIGSLFGTEMLIRFVPPVEFDPNVGKFSFYGLGLKHSLSQYLGDTTVHLAVQGVYQHTSLTNTVGVTNSQLSAVADIWNANIHASKRLFGFLDVFAGVGYQHIDVVSTYTYVLPQEVQIGLGLLPEPPSPGLPSIPTPEQPGDDRPQQSIVNVGNTNINAVFGACAQIGPIRVFADYNLSQFSIFSGGIELCF
jgi:hypothetical protein